MRNLFLLVSLSLPLAGCLAERDKIGAEPTFRTAETAQSLGLLTPAIAKECSDQMASTLPKVRIVGPFFISASAALRGGAHREMTFLPRTTDDVVAVAAPTESENLFGSQTETLSGCIYRLRDSRLVFEQARIFGRRIDWVRDKPDKT
jgi:hypothetical protein